ncbi:PDGLE domain-containing protein [Desulforegula conservatrix]|uniref:PDGLE domain-containing protein n=1 Tax=Desulforegula conservatrix TaxID=153026 RepID=UPI00041A0C6F|nr:PDGLE domain-containing protein [Desulforegula conservatrix]
MMGIHLVIAVFEGIITICVLRLAESIKSDLCLLGLAVTAGLVSPLASSLPDGLETAAHALGITSAIQAGTQVFSPIFMEYTVPFLPGPLSAIMAGVAGVWISYGVGKRILLMGDRTACFISKIKNH